MEGIEDLPNLASAQLGTEIIYATDEWFAAADNMVSDSDPVWKEEAYTTFGKWMDGWESRRRRTEGHDWCILKLGLPGVPRIIEVDTAFFTGNFSPKVSVYAASIDPSSKEAAVIAALSKLRAASALDRGDLGRMGLCASDEENAAVAQLNSENWPALIALTPLGAGYEETRRSYFKISASNAVTHLRINMGPDGGIARVRVYGEVVVNPATLPAASMEMDLASVMYGGRAIAWSNRHYGHPRNLISPGRGNCMGDGWETARQPARPAVYEKGADGLMVLPGCDWALLKLGIPGYVTFVEVDTNFYKGNYPESCMIEACCLPPDYPMELLQSAEADSSSTSSAPAAIEWKTLLPRVRLGPSAQHFFRISDGLINNVGRISHVKVTIYPDGGIMRLRVVGKRSPDSRL